MDVVKEAIDKRIGNAAGLNYRGTWQRATGYQKGNVVTYDGSAWCALKMVEEGEKPSSSDNCN